MIETVFGFLALSWVPWVLSGLLIVGALAVWFDFRRRVRPVLTALDGALQVIEGAADPAVLRDRWPTIDARLAADQIIGRAWRSFARSVVPVPGPDAAMGATRRPGEDLDETVLRDAGIDLRFYTAVPNYLVGLGLLFTFLGLVAALYFASAGVAAASVQDAQGALRDLLAAATFKFVTSIAGLGASIAYSWREKGQLHQVACRLGALCAALDQRLVPLSPTHLGLMQVSELKSHGVLLRRLGRQLHVTVPATIEERLAAELLTAMQPLHDGFARAADRLAELDQDLLDGIARRLRDGVAPGSGPRPTQLPASNALLDELGRLRAAIEDLPARLPPAPATGAPADPEIRRALPELVELLRVSGVGLEALETRIERSLAPLRTTLDELDREGGLDRRQLADRLRASSARLDEARIALQDLGRAFRRVSAGWRRVVEADDAGSGRRDPALQAALEQLSEDLARFDRQVRTFTHRVDQELARSSQLLSGAVDGGPV